jgi:hypothetical protein
MNEWVSIAQRTQKAFHGLEKRSRWSRKRRKIIQLAANVQTASNLGQVEDNALVCGGPGCAMQGVPAAGATS